MKKLIFNEDQFKAEKIIKTDTDIIGQDSNGNEVFAFKGISDFTVFTVSNEDGTNTEFDSVEPTLEEKNRADIDYILVMQGL